MSSLAFLVALIGMVVIVRWAVANDRAGDRGRTTGLLAMKDPNAAPEPVAAGGRQGRGRAERSAERSARRSTADTRSRTPAEASRPEPVPDWTLGDAVGADFSIAQVKPSGPSAAGIAADETSDAGTTPSTPRGAAPARRRRSR